MKFCEHLNKMAAKVSSRNYLLSKLAGTSWGANAETLHTAMLALCYSTAEYCTPVWLRSAEYCAPVWLRSAEYCTPVWLRSAEYCTPVWLRSAEYCAPVWLRSAEYCAPVWLRSAEYCAPVWLRSAHTKLLDAKLHSSMRIVSGTVRSTPLAWLPVLSNIAPPHLRRQEATARLISKVRANDTLPLHADIEAHPAVRLESRWPVWRDQPPEGMTAITAWRAEWTATDVANHFLVAEPSVWPPGADLPRQSWSLLNRFRTGQGRCAVNLVRWGQATDPNCSCGQLQTMSHIVNDCALTKFDGGLTALHNADTDAARWLSTLCTR